MVSFGPFQEGELIILLIIILILFGPGKLPQLARALGESMREFRKAMSGEYESKGERKKKEDT
ncbi:MAG: twin-arginine translocase TatA/TatE family subunit [Thermoprotei archaeon]|nr:twin-arginine translocase TatA/TatE family subunit [Thermoprotei archaeon]